MWVPVDRKDSKTVAKEYREKKQQERFLFQRLIWEEIDPKQNPTNVHVQFADRFENWIFVSTHTGNGEFVRISFYFRKV